LLLFVWLLYCTYGRECNRRTINFQMMIITINGQNVRARLHQTTPVLMTWLTMQWRNWKWRNWQLDEYAYITCKYRPRRRQSTRVNARGLNEREKQRNAWRQTSIGPYTDQRMVVLSWNCQCHEWKCMSTIVTAHLNLINLRRWLCLVFHVL